MPKLQPDQKRYVNFLKISNLLKKKIFFLKIVIFFFQLFQVVTFASNTTNNGDLKPPTLFEKLRKGSKATVTDSAGSHSPYEQRDSIVPNNHLDDIHFDQQYVTTQATVVS